jgi:hypothetical protein
MEKSANKIWRESGTTLTFKEWISRENMKKEETSETFIPFIGEDIVNKTLQDTTSSDNLNKNYNKPEKTNTVLGLNKGVLIFSSMLIVGSLGFYFYSRLKNKK